MRGDIASGNPEGDTGYVADLNLWLGRSGLVDYPAADEFLDLAATLRAVQDLAAGSRAPVEAIVRTQEALRAAEHILAGFAVGEPAQVAARLLSDPGRGQTLIPPLTVIKWDSSHVYGYVRFTRFYLGSNGAAHGGAISLLFDDLLGQLANLPRRPRARTASIRVDYRRITPIDRDLSVSAHVAEQDGRKIVIVGELSDGADVLVRAQGLFIQLRSDQP